MLSRIRRLIEAHRESVGMAIVGIGLFWLLGVAGTDDFNVHFHHFAPLLSLMLETAAGLIVMIIGVRILNGGGDPNENRL